MGAINNIYCPQIITCQSYAADSCRVAEQSKDSIYFGKLKALVAVAPKNYIFRLARSSFHSFYTEGYCEYGDQSNPVLRLDIKPSANIETSIEPADIVNWVISGRGEAVCYSSSTKACPLKNRLGFVIYNVNLSNGITAISNGINLVNINNYRGNDLIGISQYVAITDEDALLACGNVSECSIEINSGKSLRYGSITIDMSTMKILKIDNVFPSKIQIRKVEPFNSIEIMYQDSA